MRRVIIESPFAGDTPALVQRNRDYLARCVRDSLNLGEAPFASHGFYTRYLDDGQADQRAAGIAAGQAWMEKADAVAVYVDLGVSPGMHQGIDRARALGIRVEMRTLGGNGPDAW